MLEGEAMKRKILVRLDIDGATDTHCGTCIKCDGRFLFDGREYDNGDDDKDSPVIGYIRSPDCISAEKEAKANEDSKCES
jgi:hypothetical protein